MSVRSITVKIKCFIKLTRAIILRFDIFTGPWAGLAKNVVVDRNCAVSLQFTSGKNNKMQHVAVCDSPKSLHAVILLLNV